MTPLNATDTNGTVRPNGAARNGAATHNASAPETIAAAVTEALSRLRYGAVHLTVHDGRVVQLDVTERQRFT